MNLSNFYLFTFLLLILCFAASCRQPKAANSTNVSVNQTNENISQSAQPAKLTTFRITRTDKEPFSIAADLKHGKWNGEKLTDDNFEFIRQVYCLSNSPKFNETFVVTADGEFLRVCFSINESKRWEDRGPLKAGTYYVGGDERSDTGKIVILSVEAMKDNRPIQASINVSNNYGNITIEAVTESSVSGKISLSDNNFSINGSFAADLP